MLNKSNTPLYFRELSNPVVKAQDEKGIDIRVRPYLDVYRVANPNSYRLIQPGRLISSSVQVLVGCDDRAYRQFDRIKDRNSDDYQMFEENSFLNWGRACLNVKLPGTYTLSIEHQNQFVIVSRSRPKIMTAVGTIRSTPLTIHVLGEGKE